MAAESPNFRLDKTSVSEITPPRGGSLDVPSTTGLPVVQKDTLGILPTEVLIGTKYGSAEANSQGAPKEVVDQQTPVNDITKERDTLLTTKGPVSGKGWRRYALPLAAAAVFSTAGCSIPDSASSAPNNETNITATTEQQGPKIPTIDETMQRIESGPAAPYLSTDSVGGSTLSEYIPDSAYTTFSNYDEKGDVSMEPWPYESAPLAEIGWDKEKGKLTFTQQTDKDISDMALHSLLKPFTGDNSALLDTAFGANQLDRVVIRVTKFNANDTSTRSLYGQYEAEDRTDKQKDAKKTIFLFVPGYDVVSQEETKDFLNHETIHSLVEGLGISEGGVTPTEADSWKQGCADIRGFALDDAERYKVSIGQQLKRLEPKITDTAALGAFRDVEKAIKNGSFKDLQPIDPNDPVSAEVPECRVVDPWKTYINLLHRRGIPTNFLDHDYKDQAWVQFDDTLNALHDNWAQMIESSTIMTEFKEGSYLHAYSPDGLTIGHPEDNVNELFASTANVALNYPDKMKEYLNYLQPDRAQACRAVITNALDALVKQYPDPQFHGINQLVQTAREKVLA